ncbi:hypothetical protein STEG23_036242, partial [Scotinomys teguina]
MEAGHPPGPGRGGDCGGRGAVAWALTFCVTAVNKGFESSAASNLVPLCHASIRGYSAEQPLSGNTETGATADPGSTRSETSSPAPEVPSGVADVCLPGFQQEPENVVASTGDEMWSEGRYDYERLPRERVPPRSHASDGYHRVVNVVPKRPPLLDKRPPLLDKRPPLLARPDEGGYSRYYSHVDYRDYDEGRSYSHDRRSGPPHRGDDSAYRWTRDDHSTSRQPEY